MKGNNIEENKEVNENVNKFNNGYVLDNKQKLNDSLEKEYYEKKKLNLYKKKDINEKNITNQYANSKKGSFAKLNELREITSKLASEVEKKIELINKNKLISKTKSSPKLTEMYAQLDYKNFKINSELDNNKNEQFNVNKDFIQNENEKENMLINKSNKYNWYFCIYLINFDSQIIHCF